MQENRKRLSKLNTGIFVMMIFLFYVIFLIIDLFKKDTVSSYEVHEGSLAQSNIYEGVILRDEEIIYSPLSGYIDYFAREGEHTGNGDVVFAVDESGTINQLIGADNGGDNSLSNEDLSEIRTELVNFQAGFDDTEFYKVYDFEYDLEGLVLKYDNINILNKIDSLNSLSDSVYLYKNETPGYVVYNVDGYESLSVNGINAELFEKTDYEKTQLVNNSLIDSGAPAYKIITSDIWQIVIPIEDDRALELSEAGYINVKVLSNQREMKASVEVFQVLEDYYAILTFNNGVMEYCKDRFLEIEIVTQEETGLKIPISSLVKKVFFIIPEEYAVEEGQDNHVFFLRKTFLEDGTVSAELVSVEVYGLIDGYYYVNDVNLELGDYLLMKDSVANEYPVSTQAELQGVYNMNMGYADFRQINILYQNEEYAIVSPNTRYGLREYDFIVLDSTTVKEDMFVYE